jgi:hypothetical protein
MVQTQCHLLKRLKPIESLIGVEIEIGIESAGIIDVYDFDFDSDFDSGDLFRHRIPKVNDIGVKLAT